MRPSPRPRAVAFAVRIRIRSGGLQSAFAKLSRRGVWSTQSHGSLPTSHPSRPAQMRSWKVPRAGTGRPGPDRGGPARASGGVMMGESRPLRLRGGLHRLSRGLIVFGIVGLIVSAIGFGALVWANDRVGHLHDDTDATIARLASTTEVAAIVLQGASTTATSFSATVDQSAQAISAAAVTATEVRLDLSALEAQLRSVSILGATPLSSPADAVGRIAASMEGLDGRLAGIAEWRPESRCGCNLRGATPRWRAPPARAGRAGRRPSRRTDPACTRAGSSSRAVQRLASQGRAPPGHRRSWGRCGSHGGQPGPAAAGSTAREGTG